MGLESTMICVDNSDYMRNGDFVPTRLQSQQDAVNIICHSKARANPENNVGLLTLANSSEVLATLTTDVGRILSKLHQVTPCGNVNLLTGIRIAHLALKHRQGKNHKMRIVVFVGSPVVTDEKELVKLAKRLKKEKVMVDVINFGEESHNTDTLTQFVNTLNGKEGTGSHLVTVSPGPHLADALISSPVVQGEDGAGGAGLVGTSGFEFGVDPNEDPELALALRVSMEEQRQRQEEQARRAREQSAQEAGGTTGDVVMAEPGADTPAMDTSAEESLLEKALAMSLESTEREGGEVAGGGVGAARVSSTTSVGSGGGRGGSGLGVGNLPDFSQMSEDDQIAYAMQMSMQDAQEQAHRGKGSEVGSMEVDEEEDYGEEEEEGGEGRRGDEDYSEVISDPAFLRSVLENLPGVDPQSETVRSAVGSLATQQQEQEQKKKDEKKKDEKKKDEKKDAKRKK